MASEAMCRGFKSLQARQSGPLAQLVEQLTLNQRVVGSIPTRPTTLSFVSVAAVSGTILNYLSGM